MEERDRILEMLEPLFEQAVEERKWFYCSYQQITLSPAELRAQHKEGRLIWGPVNWRLKDPPKYEDPNEAFAATVKRNNDLASRIDAGWAT